MESKPPQTLYVQQSFSIPILKEMVFRVGLLSITHQSIETCLSITLFGYRTKLTPNVNQTALLIECLQMSMSRVVKELKKEIDAPDRLFEIQNIVRVFRNSIVHNFFVQHPLVINTDKTLGDLNTKIREHQSLADEALSLSIGLALKATKGVSEIGANLVEARVYEKKMLDLIASDFTAQ